MKKWLKKIFAFLAFLLLLIFLVVLWLQTSSGKSFVRKEVVNYLHKKLGTEVQIGQIDYHLPKWLELKAVMIKDQRNDTLVYGQSLFVDLDMLKLINSNIVINKIQLQNIYLNAYRPANDTAYSFQFIINAFSSPSSKPATAASKPLQLSLDKFDISEVSIHLMDYHNKMFVNAKIGNLSSTFKSVNVDEMDFRLNDLLVKNTYIVILDDSSPTSTIHNKPDTSAPMKLHLFGNKIDLQNTVFYYKSVADYLSSYNRISNFSMNNADFNMDKFSVVIGNIQLNNSFFDLQSISAPVIVKKDAIKIVLKDNTPITTPWNIAINKINIASTGFNYDNNYFKLWQNQLDLNHIHAKDISLVTDNIAYNSLETKANLQSGCIALNGRKISIFKTNFQMDSSGLSTKDLAIRTNLSSINGSAAIKYNKVGNDGTFNSHTTVITNIDTSKIALDDIYFFAPFLKPQLQSYFTKNAYIKIQGGTTGTMQDLAISKLQISTSDGLMNINASGHLGNVMNPDKLQYNLAVNTFQLNTNLLPVSIKNSIRKSGLKLPPYIQITGKANGDMKQVQPNLIMSSAFGQAIVSGSVVNFMDTKNLTYNLKLIANNLETGKWVGMDSVAGKLTGTITANGSGIDIKRMNLAAIANVRSIRLNNYVYHGINIKSNIKKGMYALVGNINDQNLQTDLDIKGSMQGNYPTVNGFINVVNANFRKLGFTADTISLATNIILDVKNIDPKSMDAKVNMISTSLNYNGQNFVLDSMFAKAETIGDTSKINLTLPFATALLVGKYDYTKLPAAVTQFIQKNYLNNDTTNSLLVDQQAQLIVNVQQNDLMKKVLPNLSLSQAITLNAGFNGMAKDSVLVVNMSISDLKYTTTSIRNLTLKAHGTGPQLDAVLMSDEITNGTNKYEAPTISINFKNNLATIKAKVKDVNNKPYYAVKSLINLKKDETIISLSDSLKLNYADWTVNDSNAIHVIKGDWYVDNFDLHYRGHSIHVNSEQPNVSAPVDINITDFNLGDLLAIANTDTLLANGVLNAKIKLQKPIAALPIIDGNMSIKNLTIKGNEVGDINLSANTTTDQQVILKGAVTGHNSLSVDGNYSVPNQIMDVNVVLQHFDMATAQVFSSGMLERSTGNINGNVHLSGSTNDIRWKGALNFDSIHFAAAGLNSLYSINKQSISFYYPNISFDHFTISDSLNHTFKIDGNIIQHKLPEFGLDLNLKTNQFIVSNSSTSTNAAPFYGVAIMDADMDIEGSTNAPDISGEVTLEDKSDIHYTIPQTTSYKDQGDGIVRFVSKDSLDNITKMYSAANHDTLAEPAFKGLKYNLNMEVKEGADITVLIDPTTGDQLKIKGTANLNAGVDENGQLGLTGVYHLKQGAYKLTYQFIKRDFTLKDGSTITFAGNPMNGVADVTAQYEVLASAKDLLGNEISETTSNLGAGYSAKIPFDVLLKITGPILKPKIDFEIDLKPGAGGVKQNLVEAIQNKLDQLNADEASRTKQVFALLIMGRFIGENSNDFFASTSSGNTSTGAMVKNSVSEFLAQAVQQIASDLIKGVDVNIDLKNTEATNDAGARSDLSVGLTKRLLDDRLSVSVGKSFNIDGDDAAAKSQTNNAIDFLPDINTNYKLSKDGKYMLKLYRKNAYEAILDGYFIETGVTFSLNLNYNKLKELLAKKPK